MGHILCKCKKVYIGQTACSIESRVNKCHCHIRLHQLEKLAVVEHSTDLHKKSRHRDQLIRKTTKIKLHLNNMNSEDRFSLSRS
jgi:hypothetical protein